MAKKYIRFRDTFSHDGLCVSSNLIYKPDAHEHTGFSYLYENDHITIYGRDRECCQRISHVLSVLYSRFSSGVTSSGSYPGQNWNILLGASRENCLH